jgi:hypothetical protein
VPKLLAGDGVEPVDVVRLGGDEKRAVRARARVDERRRVDLSVDRGRPLLTERALPAR